VSFLQIHIISFNTNGNFVTIDEARKLISPIDKKAGIVVVGLQENEFKTWFTQNSFLTSLKNIKFVLNEMM